MQLFSSQWFDALEAVLLTVDGAQLPVARLALGQIITETPTGELRYTIIFGGNSPVELVRGDTARAVVTLVESYETARAIASGTPATDLLAAGRIKVRGDTNALLAAQDGFGRIAEAMTELARTTEV